MSMRLDSSVTGYSRNPDATQRSGYGYELEPLIPHDAVLAVLDETEENAQEDETQPLEQVGTQQQRSRRPSVRSVAGKFTVINYDKEVDEETDGEEEEENSQVPLLRVSSKTENGSAPSLLTRISPQVHRISSEVNRAPSEPNINPSLSIKAPSSGNLFPIPIPSPQHPISSSLPTKPPSPFPLHRTPSSQAHPSLSNVFPPDPNHGPLQTNELPKPPATKQQHRQLSIDDIQTQRQIARSASHVSYKSLRQISLDEHRRRGRKRSSVSDSEASRAPSLWGLAVDEHGEDTVIRVVDDSDGDDHEEEKTARAAPPSMTGHVHTVHGSTHQFTVINYDEQTDDDDDASPTPPTVPSPVPVPGLPPGRPTSQAPTSTTDRQPAPTDDESMGRSQRTPSINRTLSLEDEQEARKAVENKLLKAVRFGAEGVAEDCVDEPREEVYKSWDWRLMDVARWGRLFGQRKQNRLVCKNGDYNIVHMNQAKKSKRYLQDIFTTLLEMRWRYIIILLVVSFLAGWVLFALLWWLIASVMNNGQECVIGVHDFVTALLFSIETQQTIGYGTRAVTAECAVGTLLVMVQSVFGVLIQCVLTGLVFAKLARAKKRGETLMFSKNAVISRHRGDLCLMFQIADMRRAHMICVSVSGLMVKHSKLQQGDMAQSMRHYRLALHTELDDFLFLAMPVRVIHTIDEHSPLYDMSPEQLLMEDFEIIVVLEGVNETTGMSTQVRTSYLPGEIMWGHKHGALITNQRKNGVYNIDYTRFNDVVPVDTPELSARQMREQGNVWQQQTTFPAQSHLNVQIPFSRQYSNPFQNSQPRQNPPPCQKSLSDQNPIQDNHSIIPNTLVRDIIGQRSEVYLSQA